MKFYLYLLFLGNVLPLSFLNEYNKIKNSQFKINESNLKKNQGMDMRFNNYNDCEIIILNKINENIEKQALLKKLENENISEKIKISMIKNYNVIEDNFSPNLLAGGLLNDYNFKI